MQESPTLTAYEKSKTLFSDENKIRTINVIVEAKGDTLLTKEVFSEMIEFEEILYSVSEFSDTGLDAYGSIERKAEGKLFKFSDVCPQVTLSGSGSTRIDRVSPSIWSTVLLN